MSDLPQLKYCRPTTIDDAMTALRRRGARIYAGGTDLVVALSRRHDWVHAVRELIDIKDLVEAQGITDLGDELRIGSLTTAAQLSNHVVVRRHARALFEAAAHTSSPPLRARGTIGGNLATPHPAGDVFTALLALDAQVELAEEIGARPTVRSLTELHASRSTRPDGRTLILAVRLKKCRQSAFEKVGTRRVFSRAVVAVAVALRDGRSSVAIGGLAERPFLARHVAAALDAGNGVGDAMLIDERVVRASADALGHTSLGSALVARAFTRARRARGAT